MSTSARSMGFDYFGATMGRTGWPILIHYAIGVICGDSAVRIELNAHSAGMRAGLNRHAAAGTQECAFFHWISVAVNTVGAHHHHLRLTRLRPRLQQEIQRNMKHFV